MFAFQGTLQQFVDDFFRSVLCSGTVVPPAVKYFFDFLDEQAQKHDNVDDETIHIWKTNRYETLNASEQQVKGTVYRFIIIIFLIFQHFLKFHNIILWSTKQDLTHISF